VQYEQIVTGPHLDAVVDVGEGAGLLAVAPHLHLGGGGGGLAAERRRRLLASTLCVRPSASDGGGIRKLNRYTTQRFDQTVFRCIKGMCVLRKCTY
jgi:hypothetical protein